jgi:hypothetical protein
MSRIFVRDEIASGNYFRGSTPVRPVRPRKVIPFDFRSQKGFAVSGLRCAWLGDGGLGHRRICYPFLRHSSRGQS